MKPTKWGTLALAPALLAGVAMAGDYHKNGTLLCGQCHIMHYSQSHGYNLSNPTFFFPPPPGGPHEYLLRDEINNLCLACHDQNGFAPDVFGSANGGNGPTDVRLGGYLNRVGVAGQFEESGHTLDSVDDAPGSNPTWNPQDENGMGVGLRCTNCHHQHGYAGGGNNSYRNLKRNPGNLGAPYAVVTYNDTQIGTVDLTKDVFERQEAEYDEGDMDWLEPDTSASKIAEWCGGCHNDFHGAVGSTNIGGVASGAGFDEFVRHPVAGVNIGALTGGHSSLSIYNSHDNKVKVMSAVGVWDPAGSDVTPTCISCHKAHGNGNAFGLIYRSGTGTLTVDGDSGGTQVEALCGQCHTQASFFAPPSPVGP